MQESLLALTFISILSSFIRLFIYKLYFTKSLIMLITDYYTVLVSYYLKNNIKILSKPVVSKVYTGAHYFT